MTNQVMIYEVKKAASSNAKNLFSSDSNFFYWNETKFRNLKTGDIVFVVNRTDKWILFTKLDKKGISSNVEGNKTTFVDQNLNYSVDGKWDNFIRLEIIKKVDIPNTWMWKSLGNSEITYINGPKINKDSSENRVKNINQLKNLTDDDEYQKILNHCLLNFSSSANGSISKENKEKYRKFEKKSVRDIIEYAHLFILNRGFNYKFEEIANFYLSLRAKPFVILAGISGTGKTQLPRKFAEALGFSEKQLRQIPVKPDWTDSSELIGYVSLDGKFIEKELTLAIKDARSKENQNKPYFFILDEMNLARVEHYFSDFLSVIETRKRNENRIETDPILREELLKNANNSTEYKQLFWPQNLFLIGTVNMDETTHTFSRKVLDRANSIEMNEVDLNWIVTSDENVSSLKNIDYSYFETPYIISNELAEKEKESVSDELEKLIKINRILQKADLHFAYRVRDEIAFYLVLNKKYELMDDQTAFDFQLVQKVLPRIHGSSDRINKVLIELLYFIEKGTEPVRIDQDFDRIASEFPLESLKYKRASRKILFMLKRFDEDRFTSFWL